MSDFVTLDIFAVSASVDDVAVLKQLVNWSILDEALANFTNKGWSYTSTVSIITAEDSDGNEVKFVAMAYEVTVPATT